MHLVRRAKITASPAAMISFIIFFKGVILCVDALINCYAPRDEAYNETLAER
jgi:hypothetical protein